VTEKSFLFRFPEFELSAIFLDFVWRPAHYHARMVSGRGLLEHAQAALPEICKGAVLALGWLFTGEPGAVAVRKFA